MPRRANGEGAISQRQDGRWQASLRVGDKRRYVYGKTRQECFEKLEALKAEAGIGPPVEPTKLTAREYFEQWLAGAEHRLRPTTTYLYEILLRVHIVPVIGGIRLDKLAPPHLNEIARKIRERGASERTVEQALRLVNKMLGDAVRAGLLKTNVAARIDIVTAPAKKIKIWNAGQTEKFIARCLLGLSEADTPYDALWLFLLGSGCRLGEAMGLRVEDVDWAHNAVNIERSISYVGYQAIESTPKTSAGIRTIVLPDFAMEALRVQRDRATPTSSGVYFFRTAGGRVPHPSDARKRFIEACNRAGVPPMRIHGLRHLHASLAVRLKKGDVKTLQKRLGHASLAMTLGIYAEAMDGGDADIAEGFNIFGKGRNASH